jgi:hypothetical protein
MGEMYNNSERGICFKAWLLRWKTVRTSKSTRSGVVGGIISCELIGASSRTRLAEEE